ncbi:hypothetical protein A4A49_19474 [Nicotiana attenuata]|uniref:Uncharacterized protein n=1 Tax=Nicotiana attenuata TaxID=49451 RepID=A0A314KU12_NICAT|nr:hypothetical protein A4A49_19474 [Nicotiana attenuata]
MAIKHRHHPTSNPDLKSRSCDQFITAGEINGGGRSEALSDLDLTKMPEFMASFPSLSLTFECIRMTRDLFLHHYFLRRKKKSHLSSPLPFMSKNRCINTVYFVFSPEIRGV